MTFELTVTLQIQAETLGAAVTEIEGRIRPRAQLQDGEAPVRLSAFTGKIVSDPKETR
jgi:hypothetical protein